MVYDLNEPGLWLTMGLLQMWAWTGTDWVPNTPEARPPERFDFGLAYDTQLKGLVAVCGYGGEGVPGYGEMAPSHDDTWLWKDSNWTELHPPTRPARGVCAAAFDAARGALLLFSSLDGSTWTFDGATWTQKYPTHAPAVSNSSMAYDVMTEQVVLFGGYDQSQPHADMNQTWTWDGSDWSRRT